MQPVLLRNASLVGAGLLLGALGCAQRDAAPARSAMPPPAAPPPASAPPAPRVVEPVRGDANPQAASVAEALAGKGHPERLSMLIAPKPFDREAFRRDPAAYLAVVEPGRCFQVAQPGPDVPLLVPVGATAARIAPDASVRLAVRTSPGMPASFTSTDLGSFENALNAITVAADEQGVATVTFTATPGVARIAHVIAGSPVASGQVHFQVDVQTPALIPVPEQP